MLSATLEQSTSHRVPAARPLPERMESAHESGPPTSVLGALAWPLVGYEAMVAILVAWIGLDVKSTGPNLWN